MTGYIDKNTPISSYQPTSDVIDLTCSVRDDYDQGVSILNEPYLELNDRSIIDDENRGQMMFNAFVDTSVEDPKEAWKYRGTRSMARNKAIAMHANLTANFLLPTFLAQNENDETDRDFSEAMRDIIEWMTAPTVSNYQSSFLQVVFGMITNPVTYMAAEYCEVFQKIKERQEDGTYSVKEILDEVLSGFKAPILSSSQVLITNAYERNIQKQRRIIKRRYCEMAELEAKYGDHPNWGFVQVGIKSIYNDEDGVFYDIKDDDHPNLVAEEIALCRRDDSEHPFINGIYMGHENVEWNPIKHRDNMNAPKYNVTPFGYHRIGEHFYFYKSMMNTVGWDNNLFDAMSEVVMNRAFLEVDMPVAISGTDKIDSDVIFPSSVVTMKDPNARVTKILPDSNFAAGFNALRETEESINKLTMNETMSGQLPDKEQKAYSVAQAQASAKKLIGAVGKSLAESVVMFGDLMKDIALNNVTAPQVEDLLGGGMKLKYRSFLLENKQSAGKRVNKKIVFDEYLIGQEATGAEKDQMNMELLEESGYPHNNVSILKLNPELFARYKYLTRADVEEMFAKNSDYWQALLPNLYTMLRDDPLINGEMLLRKLTYAYFQSGGDSLIRRQVPGAPIDGQQKAAPKQLSTGVPGVPVV